MQRILLVGVLMATPVLAAPPESDPVVRFHVYPFFARGASFGEDSRPLTGGGAGGDAFVWKGLALGGEVSAYRQSFGDGAFRTNTTFAAFSGTYHFARNARRGAGFFLSAGIGRFFESQSCGVTCDVPAGISAQGGVGLNYWLHRHIGIRAEFCMAGRDYGDDMIGFLRLGITFR
jgi:hypothetical protein